jgi:hypothetical protein
MEHSFESNPTIKFDCRSMMNYDRFTLEPRKAKISKGVDSIIEPNQRKVPQ